MADSKPSPLDSQLYSQSWTTIEDMRDRVSRHSDILNRLVLTMGRQEDLLERLAALAEQHTQMLAALARLVPAPRSTPPPPSLETVAELAEALADMLGLSNQHVRFAHMPVAESGQLQSSGAASGSENHADDCGCRLCWCGQMEARIRAATA